MKEFLSRNGVEFQERHVDNDQEAYKEFVEQKLGTGVPVTVIDGEKVVGFNQERLAELLNLQTVK